jgi:hypothetical protein
MDMSDRESGAKPLHHERHNMHSQPDRVGELDAWRNTLSIIRDHEFQQTVLHATELHPHRSRARPFEGMPQCVAHQLGSNQAQRKCQICGQFNGFSLDFKSLLKFISL